jgi:acyl carrier protein
VLRPGSDLSRSALQQWLGASLPAYMVPARFVVMEALPLTPNGKIDRAALPAPTAHNTLPDDRDSAPQTATEETMAGVVAELLQVERVGRDENFFLLGGHSMLGAQLVRQVAATFGLELPLRVLFKAPTVRQLSAEVERRLWTWLEGISEEEAQRLLE